MNDETERYVLFPIQNHTIWTAYKKQMSCFWTPEEIDLTGDRFNDLTKNEQTFILRVLAFFASSDILVNENLISRFVLDSPCLEATFFYNFQRMMEDIHSETYALLIDTYVKDTDKKNELFSAFKHNPSIRAKADFIQKYMKSDLPYALRLVAFAAVEGILFSSSFCAIYYFKKRGMLPGLTFSNELISRDEGMHCDFACLLFNQYSVSEKPTEEQVLKIVKESVKKEESFVEDALQTNLIGMNATLMKEYVRFCADRLLVSLGYTKYWNAKQPFEFMDLISVDGKTNFFEKRVGEYAKAGVCSENNHVFSIDEDF